MMNQQEMIESLRAEIAKLQGVLDLLVDGSGEVEGVRRPGRLKGSGNRATSFNPEEFAPKKRTLSVEGKARIVAAQKRRWAAQKSVATGRSPRSEAAATKRTRKAVSKKPADKAVPANTQKRAGKRTGSTQAKAQGAPAKRAAAIAKKSAGKKNIANTASKQVVKSPLRQVVTAPPEA